MAKMSLREYANQWLKKKGIGNSEAKKQGKKYKSISAAKKAGALYYTDKNGKLQLAVYAEDLKRASSPKPKTRPEKKGTPSKRLDTKGKTPKTKKDKAPETQQATKQPKTETTASKTPARSKPDSKAATTGTTRTSPSRPSYARSPEGAPRIAASTVKARESIEAGKKATGSPVTPTTNKQEKMGNTPIREGSYVGTPTKNAPPKEEPKAPKKEFPPFSVWRKTNRGGIVAYNKAKKKAGFSSGGMAKKTGYRTGGVVKANCGASMSPNRMSKR